MDNAYISEEYGISSCEKYRLFISKEQEEKTIDSAPNLSAPCPIEWSVSNPANKPSVDEMNNLYSNISTSKTKPGILSLVPEFSDMYVPVTSIHEFPRPLSLLYDPNNLKLKYHELLEKCESITVDVTRNMALTVEKACREQYKSRVWFKYRAGRITASKMKAVCHANPA